jgi:hypothetical protein
VHRDESTICRISQPAKPGAPFVHSKYTIQHAFC